MTTCSHYILSNKFMQFISLYNYSKSADIESYSEINFITKNI